MANNRLTRDPDQALLGGVCAGIAERLNADLMLIRLITVALAAVTGGLGAIAYIALWIIMPKKGGPAGRPNRDQLTEEVREAGERLQEAATILARAARQAADDISAAGAKRREAGTSEGAPHAAAGSSAPPATSSNPPTSPSPGSANAPINPPPPPPGAIDEAMTPGQDEPGQTRPGEPAPGASAPPPDQR